MEKMVVEKKYYEETLSQKELGGAVKDLKPSAYNRHTPVLLQEVLEVFGLVSPLKPRLDNRPGGPGLEKTELQTETQKTAFKTSADFDGTNTRAYSRISLNGKLGKAVGAQKDLGREKDFFHEKMRKLWEKKFSIKKMSYREREGFFKQEKSLRGFYGLASEKGQEKERVYLDCTFGRGGHSFAMVESLAQQAKEDNFKGLEQRQPCSQSQRGLNEKEISEKLLEKCVDNKDSLGGGFQDIGAKEIESQGLMGSSGKKSASKSASSFYMVALDRDADSVAYGRKALEGSFAGEGEKEEVEEREGGGGGFFKKLPLDGLDRHFSLFHSKFSRVHSVFQEALKGFGLHPAIKAKGILFDLGVSSPQLTDESRGFSFAHDGPLDMGMGCNTLTAYQIVNFWKEKDLADLIYAYGEEPKSRLVAKSILKERALGPIKTTGQLSEIICGALGNTKGGWNRKKIHPATKTFQALRIRVNDEMEELKKALNQSIDLLDEGGRIAVISFHSLEDRIVKQCFRSWEDQGRFVCGHKKPVIPSEKEVRDNPRGRSGKLRWGEKVSFLEKGELKN